MPRITGPSFGQTFRAMLLSHDALHPEREARRYAKAQGLKRHAKEMADLVDRDVARNWKKAIGPAWVDRLLRHPRTYSGLSIHDLAYSLGAPFRKWYDVVYGDQSRHVHAADAMRFLSGRMIGRQTLISGEWHGMITDIRRALVAATAIYSIIVNLLNNCIRFGTPTSTALYAFRKEWKELMTGE